MAVRALQPWKAEDPRAVTEDGMFMAVRALQPWYLLLVDYQYYTL